MFRLALSTDQMKTIESAGAPVFQAARWIKHFHCCGYAHIGSAGYSPDTEIPELLNKYGFVRVPRFELNAIRLLLETYGPLLIRGAFSHRAQNEVRVPLPELSLVSVSAYETEAYAIVLNGYWDGSQARILYRDPAQAGTQFVIGLDNLKERIERAGAIFYLPCISSLRPCAHVAAAKSS